MKLNIAKLLAVLAVLLLSPVVGAATYSYDELNRLTAVTYADGATIAYSYDAGGNIGSIITTPPGVATTTQTPTTTTTGASTTTSATTTTTGSTTTTTVHASMAVVSPLAAGAAFTVAVRPDGTLWTWGLNSQGQLGDGTLESRSTPAQIGSGYVTAWSGPTASRAYALKQDGTLWAWGGNAIGQLGDGSKTNATLPVQIGSGYTAVTAGAGHTVALKADGSLWTWGSNTNGQLGDGTTTAHLSPVQVGQDYVAVAAAGNFMLAIKSDGTLWAWGANDKRQLGDGTTTQQNSPVQVQIGTNVVQVAAGYTHAVVLKADGSLLAWGADSAIMLTTPTVLGTGFVSIAAGGSHTVALKADGTIWGWGSNKSGQLASADGLQHTDIAQIASGYVAIMAGGNPYVFTDNGRTFAFKADGTLWGWGANTYGQLGDGTTTDQTSPVLIPFSFAALNVVGGWNLLGNSSSSNLDVAAAFGDGSKVTTVWKWIGSKANWAFYSPTIADGGAVYAASKGYDFLTAVAGGEGFWVNAKAAFTAPLPSGTAIGSASFQTMASGWSLIATGDNKTPSQFNATVGATTPLTTLWAWDAAQTNWYFFAPSLEANGGLGTYISNKGYLDFTANSKTLGFGTGFWVNKP